MKSKQKKVVEKSITPKTEGERLTQIGVELHQECEAIRTKYNLLTVALVTSVVTADANGAQWLLQSDGYIASVEPMLAWALATATARRQEWIRKLTFQGVHRY